MSLNQSNCFQSLVLRPHWIQFFINELFILILTIGCFYLVYFGEATIGRSDYFSILLIPGVLLLFYLVCRAIYMFRMVYVITPEQLILLRGILSHSKDYVELYRIVDYQQHRSFLQQIFGLKDVIIYTGDRNNRKVIMTGVRESIDVVSELRIRVEFNKKRRGIYEFTNQS